MIPVTECNTKVCTKCGKELPATLEYFYKVKDGLNTRCKSCIKKYKRKWYEKNEEKVLRKRKENYFSNHDDSLKKSRAYRENNKSLLRVRELETNYGVEEIEIVSLMDSQRGCCAICGNSLVSPYSKKSFSVDHDHNTGRVRGLLCFPCNTSLGSLKESIDILESMIRYIKRESGDEPR